MAKRFTDTEKWQKEWFRKLPIKMKCAWEYLRDRCDQAGIWDGDFDLMSFQIGSRITQSECEEAFGPDRFREVGDGKFYLPGFVSFQYGNLHPEKNRAHASILARVEKALSNRLLKDSPQTLPGGSPEGPGTPMEMEVDMELDMELEKEKNAQKIKLDFEALYKKYPRKIGKSDGVKKCRAQIKTPEDFECLSKAIDRFAAFHRTKATDSQYIPYFSTFMSSWRDWIDPETGSDTQKHNSNRIRPIEELDRA